MDFEALTLADLRARRSIKWRLYGDQVLPLWVAEMDVPLAEPVTAALAEAVAAGDTGYAFPVELPSAFARFAGRHWGWDVDPVRCHPVSDVMSGVREVLKVLTDPGDGVVICPPVYHPFFEVPPSVGRPVVPVPLVDGALDLAGIDAALAAGARAVLLSSPHNPTGRVWSAAELDVLDEVVGRYDAWVLADEIHAALTLPGAVFSPYLLSGERRAVALVSASKAFNLAGLKAALVVAGSAEVQSRLQQLPVDLPYLMGHLGAIASTAAFDHGDAWLAELLAHLDKQRSHVGAHLPPGVTWTPPQAGYLAWFHYGTPSPAAAALERGVALVEGTDFGLDGYARLNFGTTTEVLSEALRRLS